MTTFTSSNDILCLIGQFAGSIVYERKTGWETRLLLTGPWEDNQPQHIVIKARLVFRFKRPRSKRYALRPNEFKKRGVFFIREKWIVNPWKTFWLNDPLPEIQGIEWCALSKDERRKRLLADKCFSLEDRKFPQAGWYRPEQSEFHTNMWKTVKRCDTTQMKSARELQTHLSRPVERRGSHQEYYPGVLTPTYTIPEKDKVLLQKLLKKITNDQEDEILDYTIDRWC